MSGPLARRARPCARCPFRLDLVGRTAFPNLRTYAAGTCVLADGTGPDFGAPLFACHKAGTGPARLCAGWLAVEGHAHPSIRLAYGMGLIPAEALHAGDDWPDLFASAVEMFDVQAYDARRPA